ncbi:peptidylprolyl isomerase [Mucilaginibacter achroorhodeus]|uniref:Peptidylprolyl isomerase n=1 Tax=Mucilaginibacter achroorhodeus TaxID=2599294 RepID=A0A563UAB4_9SPHI|nr:peptidylprolyl isomerase [Mucilaginibacter achroorhodeus]TWR28256.1 peptidylprolyl isomerase [Mucilaginibacter achroorhodeus]
MRKLGLSLLNILLIITVANAQQKRTLDKIAAVVGSSIVLQSDVELQYAQYIVSGQQPNPSIKCLILQNQLTQKLLAQQAVIDSVQVKDDEVDNEVDRRMRSFLQRAGGQEQLEQFLGRSIIQYKDEMRPDIKESLVAQRMRAKITEKVNVTPLDVKNYFDKISKDSIPTYNKEVEVGEIVFQPKLSKEEKESARKKITDLRERVKKGEDFANLARIYSQDGSAQQGGDLGFFDRQQMAKEFTANAFRLKAGEISPVFETEFGFHFLQVIERRGEQVHARHIIIIPTITEASLDRAHSTADSVYKSLLAMKKLDFSSAAAFYSDDKETKYNGGMMLNAENVQTRTTFIPTDKLDPQIALVVDTMKVGSISKPQLFTDPQTNKKSYKILYLKSAVNAHKANMEQDFAKLKDAAMNDKLNRTIAQWFEKRRKETYIKIDPGYQTCDVLKGWLPAASAKTTASVADATPANTATTNK